jgi:hypothetical protein
MPVVNYDTFNTGIDLTVTITASDGSTVTYGGFITEFEATSEHDITTIKPIDVPTNVNHIAYGNYRGTISIARATGDLEDLEANNAAAYFASGTNASYTIQGTVVNQADGSMDEYQYLNAIIWLESSGTYRKDAEVPLRLMFISPQKVAS